MMHNSRYLVLAFYKFVPIQDPRKEVNQHKIFFENRDITSRIYISEEGINGQMSGTEEAAKEYMEWMQSKPQFQSIHFKIQYWHEQAFPRQTIKYRKHLVAYDERVNLTLRGDLVSPTKWREMLESEQDYLLLDIRNDYEWELGHFAGAELPKCKTFREFEEYAEKLQLEKDPKKTQIMMYCTGGIRCELYSSILIEKGFDKVYQLEGGVINYGMEEGSKHWLGKLFVFDDRMSIPVSEEQSPVVGKCYTCGNPSEAYYNCANMDCNHLFLSCPVCLEKFSGCCKQQCQQAERVRPYHQQNPHKPFRKKYHYEQGNSGAAVTNTDACV
jgi:UPF0176 protein